MRLRHASALALAGWYLMVPPIKPHGEPDIHARFSKWAMDGSFDRATSCEARYHDFLDQAFTNRPTDHIDPQAERLFWQSQAAQCIATDDPRLKGE
jgi:hypothetical protein